MTFIKYNLLEKAVEIQQSLRHLLIGDRIHNPNRIASQLAQNSDVILAYRQKSRYGTSRYNHYNWKQGQGGGRHSTWLQGLQNQNIPYQKSHVDAMGNGK